MNQKTVPIKGMHCRSCEVVLTEKLEELPGVSKATVSLRSQSAELFGDSLPADDRIENVIKNAGYTVGFKRLRWFSKDVAVYKDFLVGVIFVLIAVYVLSFFDLTSFATGDMTSGGLIAAVMVGLAAGFSTCMALVGGLVLGLSARYAQRYPDATPIEKFRPHLYFNAARIVSFFLLGGVIGLVGSIFQLQGNVIGVMIIIVGVAMMILGIQLTNISPRLSTLSLAIPPAISARFGLKKRTNHEYSHANAVALGSVSFFLPCGFTQAMQLYAISTGSFSEAALVMGLFAIGTTPGLLSVAGLTSVVEGSFATKFFRLAGVVVISMALLNIVNGVNLSGIQPSLLVEQNRPSVESLSEDRQSQPPQSGDNITLKASYTLGSGMMPKSFSAESGKDYVLEVYPLEDGVGCMSTVLIPGLNNDVQYLEKNKPMYVPFRADKAGTYKVTCAMGVPHAEIRIF